MPNTCTHFEARIVADFRASIGLQSHASDGDDGNAGSYQALPDVVESTEENINMNIDNGANMGESGEGTKAHAAVTAGEKGGNAQNLAEPDSSPTRKATKKQSRARWESRMKELRLYKETNGHLNVPTRYGLLGTFVNNQRARYKLLLEGKPAGGMTQEKANQLEALGFKWSIKATPLSWDDRMEQLREFKKDHGHVNVPQSHGLLGTFVRDQHTLHKMLLEGKAAGGMTQERANQLEALGFKWSIAARALDDRMEQLREYTKDHGHNVPC